MDDFNFERRSKKAKLSNEILMNEFKQVFLQKLGFQKGQKKYSRPCQHSPLHPVSDAKDRINGSVSRLRSTSRKLWIETLMKVKKFACLEEKEFE